MYLTKPLLCTEITIDKPAITKPNNENIVAAKMLSIDS